MASKLTPLSLFQNQKKSWHPHTFKNQERVWKAEQSEAAEKRKLAELQAEISAERDREDLRRVGQASGIIANDNGHKLEWMYRGAKDNLNREDYLLGRSVDKTYEQFAEEERVEEKQNHLGVSVPKNHVEYECVPFSIRAYKDADPTSVQVDMARKIAEDPLMMIKQREMESRKKLLENPVKLKELKQLLQSERGKPKKEAKKRSKKEKKAKKKSKRKKKKRSKSESSGSSSEGSNSDVDDALLAMLSKQRAVAEDDVNMEDLNFDEMVNLKYNTLSKELDKMIKGSDEEEEKKEKRVEERDQVRGRRPDDEDRGRDSHRRQRSSSRDKWRRASPDRRRLNRERSPLDPRRRDDNSSYGRDRRGRDRSRSRSPGSTRRREVRPRSRSGENRRRRHETTTHKREESSRRKQRSQSVDDKKASRKRSETPKRNRKASPKRRESTSSEDSPPPPPERQGDPADSDEEDQRKKIAAMKSYGLVTASGQSIALKNSAQSYTDRRASAKDKEPAKSESAWKKPSSHGRPKLTEAEKEERLREMMKNAEWRDKERESYVRKYHEDGREEEDRHREKEFDKNFIHKELHKSAQSASVESRLKANRNNIQRSSGAMNTNFARR